MTPVSARLLDEAQDANPVVEQIFLTLGEHAQLVMVGDSAQAIYHWRGAKDVMTGFDGTQLALSQSFRFGPDLAQEANRWLHPADAPASPAPSPWTPNSAPSPARKPCCTAPTSAPWPTS
ncbi:hypothetical protein TUSST3_37860 [Streptomyces sp. TUS-ST3]|nr:hypothetical protein TUSST3_37860 [Streptomyces sp. TUS-ST3]